jgi:hypothetical protein
MSSLSGGKMRTVRIPYNPHKAQKELHDCRSRFIVINTGRRFGKSTFAINELLKRASKKGRYWIISPTYKQSKSIYWRSLVGKYIPKEAIKKKNESELIIELINGSTIELKGADNEDSLRGAGLEGVILDEYAFIKPHIWQEVIQPMIVDSNGWAIFISTPKGYNHFYELCEYAKKTDSWSYFHFTSYDNPHLPTEELDRAKRDSSEDYFAQEFLADFTKHTGLVYKEFNRSKNIITLLQPEQEWIKYISIDFGTTNPTAVLFIGVDREDNIYIYDEIYQSNLYTSQLANLIKGKSGNHYFTNRFGDSAAAQSIKDLTEQGLYITTVTKTNRTSTEDWFKSGIEKVREKLKIQEATGKPKLFVASHCQNTIREFEMYSWPDKKDETLNQKERPEKANDHALDALRYFIMSYNIPTEEIYNEETWRPIDESIGY